MTRKNMSTHTPWEQAFGYSRAVRIGSIIEVAGTVAADESGNAVGASVYDQTRYILAKIGRALEAAGGSLEDVVRTRWFLTDISQLPEAGRAHGEVFGEIRPVSTGVEVSALAGAAFLIEIEATAILEG